MTIRATADDRNVIPRWRSVRRTIAAGEFQRRREARPLGQAHRDELARYRRAWERSPSTVSAGEAVGAARIAGESVPADAAAFLVQNGETPSLRNLGRLLPTSEPDIDSEDIAAEVLDEQRQLHLRARIALEKANLRADPRSALRWADLARAYTALGQFGAAERALKTARSLAPTSRYLLRISSRFYVQARKPEAAYRLLERSPRTEQDPWLMAAFLSVASNGGIRVRSLKAAKRIVEDDNFRPVERSELMSEVATFDLRDGSDHRARSLFRKSLLTPTDNSLAQVEWASHRLPNLEVPLDKVDVPYPAEARARSAAEAGDWLEGLSQAERWLRDQPIDTDAALIASYVACTGLEAFDIGARLAEVGLNASPNDPALLNNRAYALIQLGELDEAAAVLGRAPANPPDIADRIALVATSGLLEFRLGNVVTGRALYERAIEVAKRQRRSEQEAMARAMLASEEVRAGRIEDLEALLAAVLRFSEGTRHAGVQAVAKRLEAIVRDRSSHG